MFRPRGTTATVSMTPKSSVKGGAVPHTTRATRAAAADVRGPKYSVILPTYNERVNVALVVAMLVKELEAR